MMMAETNNNVWGETRNPLHKHLSPGGSSGGESALISFFASPLGIGTDIGWKHFVFLLHGATSMA